MTTEQRIELEKKRQTLLEVAREMNEVMGLEPQIYTGDNVSIEELLMAVQEAAGFVDTDDDFSEQAKQILSYFI